MQVAQQVKCSSKNCENLASFEIEFHGIDGAKGEIHTPCSSCYEKEDGKGNKYYQIGIKNRRELF